MSFERREELVDDIVNTQPELRAFIRNVAPLHDIISVSWDALSYSFQRGFETLWDQARADHSGFLLRPLILLWRQSVELALKAAITEIAGGFEGKPSHNLSALFVGLQRARADLGYSDDDDLTNSVREMIAFVQALDPFADRFRYPSSKGGKWFEGIDADLDELFQAHWIIVTYCEGAAIEVEETRNLL
ncbi:hypothetical protein ACFQRC_02075 [Enterovirga sp. GCM10030262]|uniref:hypothetical protein n=1 Tax=Enterovirga sp. GCM10030262 TaxID=3273391 RepID=UPI00360D2674